MLKCSLVSKCSMLIDKLETKGNMPLNVKTKFQNGDSTSCIDFVKMATSIIRHRH